MKKAIRGLIASALALFAATAGAQTIQLISEEEAAHPPAATLQARAITRGPGVKLLSPEAVSGVFQFKVAFEPRGGSKIDPSSVKVEYLRGSGFDLTGRVKSGINAEGIDLPSVTAPVGVHPIRISARDNEGRIGSAEFSLKIK